MTPFAGKAARRPGDDLLDRDSAALLNRVSRDNLERWVRHLAGAYPTRHTLGEHIGAAADWLAERFRSFGYDRVERASYRRAGRSLPNVICVKPAAGPAGLGGDPAAGTVILCAHFDSRSERGEDPRAPAPGADDNASGVAVLLETARLLAARRSGIPVRFAAFSGEEQGLWGAEAYAERIRRGRLRVRFVLNLDQVGHPPRSGTLTIERDAGNRVAANDAASHALADRMRRLARRYTGLPTRFGPIYGSDYLPFEARGFTVAGLYEGEGYPAYHTTRDTAEKVNFAYLHDVARLTLATVLNEEQAGAVAPSPSPP